MAFMKPNLFVKRGSAEKHDSADALLANRFGFIKAITERWKVDGRNIFQSFRGFLVHNDVFEVLIEKIDSSSIIPQTHHYVYENLGSCKGYFGRQFSNSR
ncbi:hypothetical protein QL285_031596 [Trifolium repens]|nr:hypothetical protein QL285_031596 [Trifolium repens]